jgi:hypothetical protein
LRLLLLLLLHLLPTGSAPARLILLLLLHPLPTGSAPARLILLLLLREWDGPQDGCSSLPSQMHLLAVGSTCARRPRLLLLLLLRPLLLAVCG